MALHEWLADLRRDLRLAARSLLRVPAFTAIAVATLALGIGATTTIFSVVYGVLLKPLPFDEPERLVSLRHRLPDGESRNHGPGTYFTYRDHQQAFEDVGAWESDEVSITGRGEPERVDALGVTDGTLRLLGVQPFLGRLFHPEDDRPGAPMRVVLSHGYWQRAFGGAGDVVGQRIVIDGTASEIIGVLPDGFRFLRGDPAVLLPLQLERTDQAQFDFQVLARLAPGTTLERASADVARMIPLLPEQYASLRLRMQPDVRPLAAEVVGDVAEVLWILLATVAVVLLIACGNVANLFLVRAEGRQQELAVRAALGATRWRVARALLAESVILGLAAGAVGLALAQGGIALLQRLAPATLPRVEEIAIDPAVLLFTLAASLLAGLLFGLVSVMRLATPSTMALRDGGRSGSAGPARQRTRDTLIVAEVAMALVLLVTSGLMIRTFVAMRQVEPGFVRPAEVQTFRVDLVPDLVPDDAQFARTVEQIARHLEQVPGVVSVGVSSSITMDGEDNTNPIEVEQAPVAEGDVAPLYRFKSFAPGYFETMGIPVVAGRSITWEELHAGRPVIVVSRAFAREHWGEPSAALGRRVRGTSEGPWREVVGVVGDERDDGVDRPATAIVYWPLLNERYPRRTVAYAVRSTRAGTPGFVRELRQAVWSVEPALPLAAVQTVEQIREASMARTSFVMVMLAIAAAVALLLGVVGIYGVIAYAAAQRTREIGIRIALGAQTGAVRRLFLRHGLLLTGAGIALGVAMSLALTRVMSALLFGVGPMDPVTYLAVAAGLAAVALLATWLPARRASRVDPILALRADG